jgi:hypothetical protein
MASIKVKDLTISNIFGIDLFDDLESFMQEFSENELNLQGGFGGTPLSTMIVTFVPD